MSALNWGLIQDGGVMESLMHAILYAEDPHTVLFGRPGKDAGQDARSADGIIVYQSKYRDGLDMDEAVKLAIEELGKIKKYRATDHANYEHWKDVTQWVMFANLSINPNDDSKWKSKVVPDFKKEGLSAVYWGKETIEGKLSVHPEVRDVFFEHENRVLVGLKEAHDILSAECVGNISLDVPMLGRADEFDRINAFAVSPDKRVLPVIGPGGIGKSRFLYESLVALSQNGWRVLWGLPGAMATSSKWFTLLNGAQPTCVALDDPDDPNLLRKVIEQLTAVERGNWRIIFACRSEKSETLRRYRRNRFFHETLWLTELNEVDSHSLVNNCLGNDAKPEWLHTVYRFTRGNPGWLCLVADLAKQGKLHDLPPHADDIASLYVDSCLEQMDGATSSLARKLLPWLALWGKMSLEVSDSDRADITFLETQGIPRIALHGLLRQLVSVGLVRNWGIGKRLYAIEPLVVRQQLLSEWLLQDDGAGGYVVNSNGSALVSQLFSEDQPCVDATLHTLSHLVLSRLDAADTFSFLRPLFQAMAEAAKDGTVTTQYRVADLVGKAGAADPESALDVLSAIRSNPKVNHEVDSPLWGRLTFTHTKLLSTMPWTLFTIAERVDDEAVALRFLYEFREYITREDAGVISADPGKSSRQLLKRLLTDVRHADAFLGPAHQMAKTNILSDEWWPFVAVLADCLLEPIQESTHWVSDWTVSFSRTAIHPDSPRWKIATDLRARLFESLRQEKSEERRVRIWPLLTTSHQSIHAAVAHEHMSGAVAKSYRSLLTADLNECLTILKTSPSMAEATYARPMWEWYLEGECEGDLAALARQCEQWYAGLSKWRIHDLFRFDYDEDLERETTRIAALLREAPGTDAFVDFFSEAERYLKAARRGAHDTADNWTISALADKLADLFYLDVRDGTNALSAFVLSALAKGEDGGPLSFSFAVMVCRARLGQLKATGKVQPGDWLARLLDATSEKATVLYRIYASAHPSSIGPLAKSEVDSILAYENDFVKRQLCWLLGILVGAVDESVSEHVPVCLESLRDDRYEASQCLAAFVRSSYLTFRRYGRIPSPVLVKSVVGWIVRFHLDGAFLAVHDLAGLRELSGFVSDMRLFTSLIRSRVELEGMPKLEERFEILPHRFKVEEWCNYDPTDEAERAAFGELCQLALGPSFNASYRIPKYLPKIDPSGSHVTAFVESYLANTSPLDADKLSRLAYLASQYTADSAAWAWIARPICEKAQGMARDDREHVYFGLSRKETDAMWSHPGEVPQYYISSRDVATRLLENEPKDSPLRAYREWALRRAEEDLQREEGRAEELDDE